MTERDLNQTDLAVKLGTSQGNVSRMLNGKRPPNAVTVAAVATALGVSLCDLFCEENAESGHDEPPDGSS